MTFDYFYGRESDLFSFVRIPKLLFKEERLKRLSSDAKILYECDRFDMKSKRALKGEKKYYLSDLSFYFCDNTDNRINYGPVLENLVYFYARSRGLSVSVGRIGTLECDFII